MVGDDSSEREGTSLEEGCKKEASAITEETEGPSTPRETAAPRSRSVPDDGKFAGK
jgi:hypothetical protein